MTLRTFVARSFGSPTRRLSVAADGPAGIASKTSASRGEWSVILGTRLARPTDPSAAQHPGAGPATRLGVAIDVDDQGRLQFVHPLQEGEPGPVHLPGPRAIDLVGVGDLGQHDLPLRPGRARAP